MNIKLADNTIDEQELKKLSDWIIENNKLTKGPLTLEFEKKFADYFGVKHVIYTNSGSSSNLLMIYSLLESGYLRNKVAIAPSLSWVTTVSPLMQLGFDVSLCDCDRSDLGIDLEHFEKLCIKKKPSLLILVHVLGHSNKMNRILELCKKYDIIVLEDSCEAMGCKYIDNKMLGSIGLAGSFSLYYGHHISTIEGGLVTTNDSNLNDIMLSIRSHGWSRDVSKKSRDRWTKEHEIDEVRNLYTFYYPGFNFRSTDLQAFIGIMQIDKLDKITKIRERNFLTYKEELENFFFQNSETKTLSSFAYGTLVKNRLEVYKHLEINGIESRPLICGNIGLHPFWIKKFGATNLPNADIVHEYGIYLPNHLNITTDQVKFICKKFKEVAQPILL